MDERPVEERLAELVRTQRIDATGMGEVWLARSKTHGDVVVKIFDLAQIDAPNLSVRVKRALPFLLHHHAPNLPKVFDGGVLDSAVFLVLERIEGTSLAALFEALEGGEGVAHLFDPRGPRFEDGRFDPADAARIALGILEGLRAGLAHRDDERDVPAPIVHGQIRATKVMVGKDGHVTLLGLGSGPLSRTGPMTDASAFDTAAPELARQDPATAQTDVYAVGALLFRMLTGSPPVAPGSIVKRIRALVKGERQSLATLAPQTPEGLIPIVDKALAANASDRFASAESMAAALSQWLAQSQAKAVVARADETLAWALDAIAQQDLESVARLLHDRPELGQMPAFTKALWDATADVLLDPLLDGQPLTRVQSILLGHLPEAATDLIGLVADLEVEESIRAAAARILGVMGADEAAPFLVRVLNEPFPWLRVAASEALTQLPTPQPIGIDTLAGRLVPCRQSWEALAEQPNGVRYCDRCDTRCVLGDNLAALPAEGQSLLSLSGRIRYPSEVSVVTLDGQRPLSLHSLLTLGSDSACDLRHPQLDPHHVTLRLLEDGLLLIRRVGHTIVAGDLEEMAVRIAPSDEGQRISLGPIDIMTRPMDPVVIVHAADGNLSWGTPERPSEASGTFAFEMDDLT